MNNIMLEIEILSNHEKVYNYLIKKDIEYQPDFLLDSVGFITVESLDVLEPIKDYIIFEIDIKATY